MLNVNENKKHTHTLNIHNPHTHTHTYTPTYSHTSTPDLRCPRKLYNFSKGYFSNKTAVMNPNSITIERRVTKGCPQVSCCGPGYWNVLYNSMLSLELTSHSKAIPFADDLIILSRGETVVEAENYMNLEMRKIQNWV
jgi:hypothetical protein